MKTRALSLCLLPALLQASHIDVLVKLDDIELSQRIHLGSKEKIAIIRQDKVTLFMVTERRAEKLRLTMELLKDNETVCEPILDVEWGVPAQLHLINADKDTPTTELKINVLASKDE